MNIFSTISRKIYQLQNIEYINVPICGDCKYSKYHRFGNAPVTCTALGNKATADVFNTPACREVFRDGIDAGRVLLK